MQVTNQAKQAREPKKIAACGIAGPNCYINLATGNYQEFSNALKYPQILHPNTHSFTLFDYKLMRGKQVL